ncbi:LOW QUALITY PROTEIN: regulator of G-protein signaling protein-like [Dromiciops gliroides]|uniref:LOW QUALITY PROTEIN: regulator of G-protein signaling protein-like n=1 Tax=Dromiciops gliroides TaxID=33562 RepID=UPI001CC66037|nr:LOW QUALITY PROTEIN: regulator of G-protein signaling protein-like [Dromiciops gliroides]
MYRSLIPHIDVIASTNLIVLLEDEVFADFFNTFLSLPVFGQMPIYIVHDLQWTLWPELPHALIAKYKGLLTWLEKYRLPYFCKTNLCHHYMLCKELISFIKSPEGAKMMRWKTADQWLLYKCVGGVRGMWRFCAYLSGTAGEELVEFWIIAERILGIDETNDKQKDTYLSLLLVLKATHLQEGSSVLILCNMNIKSLMNLSVWHPKQSTTRREILSRMQKVALFKIQSYWLPNFYMHCKINMAKEEKCQALLQEYEDRLCQVEEEEEEEDEDEEEDVNSLPSDLPLNMNIRRLYVTQKPYCSKKTKKKMWQFIEQGTWTVEPELPIINTLHPQKSKLHEKEFEGLPDLFSPPKLVVRMGALRPVRFKDSLCDLKTKENVSSTACKSRGDNNKTYLPFSLEGVYEKKFTARLRHATPVINQPSLISLKKVIRKSFSFEYLHWALTADSCAGNPFGDYLKSKHYKMENRLLHLWKDLDNFLTISISAKKGGNLLFRHTLGNRICELYLNEDNGPVLPLKPQTIQHLKELLPSGDVIPWIPKAQKEICKILASLFDDFLDLDDHWFLIFVSQTNTSESKRQKEKEHLDNLEYVLLCKRIQESLVLCQGLSTLEDMEALTDTHWQMIATQDLKRGGSLHLELQPSVYREDTRKMGFEELCRKNPKLAIERMSEDFKKYCEKKPIIIGKPVEAPKKTPSRLQLPSTLSFLKKGSGILRKPSLRPRSIMEVLQHPIHLDYFKEFLKINKAENLLDFILAMQRVCSESNEKLQKSLIEAIIKTFIHSKTNVEDILQCAAPILREISHMRRVPLAMLIQAQNQMLKYLDEKWFKIYQDMFPPRLQIQVVEPETKQKLLKKGAKTINLQFRKKKVWYYLNAIIRSICRFRKEMKKPASRRKFEDFLRRQMHNHKENIIISGPAKPTTTTNSSLPTKPGLDVDTEEIVYVKRRIFGHKMIIINFLVNDLSYFTEIEKFNDLVSSALVLQVNRVFNENDVALMKAKGNIIYKLFLASEIPPKLRVNISESMKDAIHNTITDGHLDRSVFHSSIMTIFPIIMHFWKKYCNWRAKHIYFHYSGMKSKEASPVGTMSPKQPQWSGGDHVILRFSLFKGIEWLLPQPREDAESPAMLSSSSSMSQKKKGTGIFQSAGDMGKEEENLTSKSEREEKSKRGFLMPLEFQVRTGVLGSDPWHKQEGTWGTSLGMEGMGWSECRWRERPKQNYGQ